MSGTMDLVRRLEVTRDETLKLFSLGDDDLARTYAPGKWPVRFILLHLADAETVLFDRIRRVLSEPRQVLWVFDQDAWAKGLDYSRVPLDISVRVYEAVRNAVIYYVRLYYEEKGHLEFVHSVTGVRTLKDEFDKVASHNQHHLDQIRAALRDSSSVSDRPDAQHDCRETEHFRDARHPRSTDGRRRRLRPDHDAPADLSLEATAFHSRGELRRYPGPV